MSSLNLKGGTPTSASDLAFWNSLLASVTVDTEYGNVYSIRPNGFINQFIYTTAIASTVSITIEYKLATGNAKAELAISCGDTEVTSVITLNASSTFKVLEIDIPLDKSNITSLSFKLANLTNSNLYVASINISGLSNNSSNTQVDTKGYMQYAIMYGSDTAKPKLR